MDLFSVQLEIKVSAIMVKIYPNKCEGLHLKKC